MSTYPLYTLGENPDKNKWIDNQNWLISLDIIWRGCVLAYIRPFLQTTYYPSPAGMSNK